MGVRYEALNTNTVDRRGVPEDSDDLESANCALRTETKPRRESNRGVKQQRLVSLDVFRGLTVAVMILVDDGGSLFPSINHSPWDGLTLADYVMPFFLFIVGLSISLTYKKLPSRPVATKNALLRFLKLLLLGLLLQGGFLHGLKHLTYGVDIQQMRWMGILQRIAIAYLAAALCEIWLKNDSDVNSGASFLRKYQLQWGVSLTLSIIYVALSYGLYVPDWEYQAPVESSLSLAKSFLVKCRVRGETGPACNAAGMIDRKILGINHLYSSKPVYARTPQCSVNSPDYGPLPPDAPSWCHAPFDPEGILSSVMAVVTCLVGLHYGHVIVHFKEHKDRLHHWLIPSSLLLVIGISLHCFGMHVNKALYSLSYTCVTAGVAGIVFAAIYLTVDMWGYKRMVTVFEWLGRHALLIFALVACNLVPLLLHGFYWGNPHNNILTLIGIGS